MMRDRLFGSTLGAVAVVTGTASPAAGIEGYADELRYRAGDVVRLHVSAPGPYDVEIVRFGAFDDPHERPPALLELPGAEPTVQQTDFGSYGEIELYALPPVFSLEAWILPTRDDPAQFQQILSYARYPASASMGLGMSGTRQIAFYLSGLPSPCASCATTTAISVPIGSWTHVVATYDGAFKRIYIDGALAAEEAYSGGIATLDEPLRIAGLAQGSEIVGHFDGHLDVVTLYDVALGAGEIAARNAAGRAMPLPPPLGSARFQYDFSESDDSAVLVDSTIHGVTASLRNHPTRGVSGPDGVGSAVRFAGDDFADAGWPVTDEFVIPADWPSGAYAARLVARVSREVAHVVFIVRPTTPASPLAVIAATNTWTAYNCWPGAYAVVGICLYATHRDGSPGYFAPLRRPNPAADPYLLYYPEFDYGHLLWAERFLYDWLEQEQIPYDLYTDLDLHDGALPLASYRAVVLAGHNEYWSQEMRQNMADYLGTGGRVVNLSGNTMYWKVTLDPSLQMMEGRKWGGPSGQAASFPLAERTHAQTGELGGLWGVLLRPEGEFDLFGTATDLFADPDAFGEYEVLEPSHWALEGIGLTAGARIGTRGRNGMTALGHEADYWELGVGPAGVQLLARGTALTGTRLRLQSDDTVLLTPTNEGGSITYWQRPDGGEVFSIPSIGVAGALGTDEAITQIVRNVLARFTAPPPPGDGGPAMSEPGGGCGCGVSSRSKPAEHLLALLLALGGVAAICRRLLNREPRTEQLGRK